MKKCIHCQEEFSNAQQYGAHIRNVHIDKTKIKKYEKKFVLVNKTCPKCGASFDVKRFYRNSEVYVSKKEKQFCSKSCANSHVQTEEQNSKRRKKLTDEKKEKRVCSDCGTKIKAKNTTGLCLSCYRSKPVPENIRRRMSESKIELYSKHPEKHPNRKCAGIWSRMSYPEQVVYLVLTEKNIIFEHNKRIGKYYPDFTLSNNLIIEVDGERWHGSSEQKKRDIHRDSELQKLGYTVYRVSAKSAKKEIEKLLENF